MKYYISRPPRIPQSQQAELKVATTLLESENCLRNFSPASASGFDGCNTKYLRHAWKQAGPLLLRKAYHIPTGGLLTRGSRRNVIGLFPRRTRRDLRNVKDYELISLISNGLRLVSAAINQRLPSLCHGIIGNRQKGFTAGRSGSHSL